MNTRIKMRTLGPVVSFFLTQKCTIREENDIRGGDFRKLEVVDRWLIPIVIPPEECVK